MVIFLLNSRQLMDYIGNSSKDQKNQIPQGVPVANFSETCMVTGKETEWPVLGFCFVLNYSHLFPKDMEVS